MLSNPFPNYTYDDTINQMVAKFPKTYKDYLTIENQIEKLLSGYDADDIRKQLYSEIDYAIKGMTKTFDDPAAYLHVLPKTMECEFENCISMYSDRFMYTVWLLEYADGTKEVRYPKQNRGWVITGSEKEFISAIADDMPENVVRAVKLVIGAYKTKELTRRGFRWTLYLKEI